VVLARAPGEQHCREQKQRALHGQEVDQVDDPTLRQHREGQQQQQRRAEVQELQVEGGAGYHVLQPPNNRCTSKPSTANRNAPARYSGARKTRSFADTVSISARPTPATASFTPSRGMEAISAPGPLPPVETPHGRNNAKPIHA